MADYSGSQKYCATCAYFIAQRDVDHYNSWVKNCENQGRCAIPQGPFRHANRSANSSGCAKYMKWPVLK